MEALWIREMGNSVEESHCGHWRAFFPRLLSMLDFDWLLPFEKEVLAPKSEIPDSFGTSFDRLLHVCHERNTTYLEPPSAIKDSTRYARDRQPRSLQLTSSEIEICDTCDMIVGED